jgi:hypothetical protein
MRGILDFDGQAVPVAFGDNVFADFTKGQLLGAGGASFTGGAGSLLSFASAAQRDSVGSISTQGLVHVAGSALTIPPDQSVGGSGTIEGDVDNQGTLAPGSSPGEIVVNGAYVQEDTGRLAVEIAGTVAAEEFDLLTVNGAVSLDGLLDVALLDDFVPAASDRFVILTSTNLNGTFDNAVIATGGRVFFPGGRFDVLYGTTSVTLTNFTAVPEPAGAVAALFLAAGATIVRRPRRRPRRRA